MIFEHAMYAHRHGVDVTIVPLFPLDVAAKDWHPALSELQFAIAGDPPREVRRRDRDLVADGAAPAGESGSGMPSYFIRA